MIASVLFGALKASEFKAIVLVFVVSIILSIQCAHGAFATREKLLSMSKWIGTKNPVLARLVCLIGLLVFTGLWIGALVIFIRS